LINELSETLPIHRSVPAFTELEKTISFSSIKVIDLFRPYRRGGKLLIGSVKLFELCELLDRIFCV